jgi:hypothetical protein
VPFEFLEMRVGRKCQLSSYEPEDEAQPQGEKRFRTEFLSVALDSAIVSLESRFELLSSFMNTFGFLCDIKKIATQSTDDVNKLCSNLELALKTNDSSSTDIDRTNIFSELQSLSHLLPEMMDALQTLLFIYKKKLSGVYSNVCILLRIVLTVLVTVASAERSFPKLKLIKSYLRSTVSLE